MANLKILVTGATGVVGRRLVPPLPGAGHQVRPSRAPGRSAESSRRVGATAVAADLFDPRLYGGPRWAARR